MWQYNETAINKVTRAIKMSFRTLPNPGQFSCGLFKTVSLVCAAAWLGGESNADPITLDPSSSHQSYVAATAADPTDSDFKSSNVDTLPYAIPESSSQGSFPEIVTSTVTPALTTSGLNFTFDQVTPANPTIEVSYVSTGYSDIYFTAGANVTYALDGSITAAGGGNGEFDIDLENITTRADIYYYTDLPNDSVDNDTVTIPTQGIDGTGPSTGSLVSGDVYEVSVYAGLQDNGQMAPAATLTGNLGATFVQRAAATPEPGSLYLFGVGVGALVFLRRRLAA